MSEGEEPASEQTGGSASPPPGLGVPGLGLPSPGGQGGTGTPPLDAGQPEIVEDHYPYVDPRGPPQRRFRLTAGRIILLAFIVLAVLGAVVTQVRHARATPADKTACSSTLKALSTPATGIPAMMHDLEFANDKTLLGARGEMTTH